MAQFYADTSTYTKIIGPMNNQKMFNNFNVY